MCKCVCNMYTNMYVWMYICGCEVKLLWRLLWLVDLINPNESTFQELWFHSHNMMCMPSSACNDGSCGWPISFMDFYLANDKYWPLHWIEFGAFWLKVLPIGDTFKRKFIFCIGLLFGFMNIIMMDIAGRLYRYCSVIHLRLRHCNAFYFSM